MAATIRIKASAKTSIQRRTSHMAFRLRADDDGWQLTDPARGPRLSDSTVRVQPYRGESAPAAGGA